ncbi:MAG: DUF1636 domain-containing protein [Cyanobacteria bacterium P01_A01_bin.123]
MGYQHTIFVCTTCASAHRTKQPIRVSGGDRLLEKLRLLYQGWSLQTEFAIHPFDCFGVCNQDCAVALSAPGKNTYLLANLPVDSDQLEPIASAVLEYADQYFKATDGTVKHMQCPNLLRKKALARLPPLPDQSVAVSD